MAFEQKNINVLDLKRSTGVGISIPFSSPSVFKTVFNTKDQIKYNLINYILTNQNERIFNPSFGLGIRNKLFEQLTDNTAQEIKQMVRAGIERYFPYVMVDVLNVFVEPEKYQLTVEMKYLITNINVRDEIFLNFNANG